ncbi:TPA: DUF1642 domain-containing protein [Enterococcus faecium]|uniref:DUF1642 domain-containing protein n=1 Tax=Enterococcus faecium TaxID=1352 RepID=UPI000BDEF830|nr:DUF1642 domain-containing protein [Enterococcus faecium]PCT04610.1 hypothetical protein BTA09_13015 [Enterococcus faecium]BDP64778.1 hypothetical protein EfmJHP80_22740 [Enterococcus faecium]HAQ6620345.1 DUF1642 domain-containing protein [Enterococcus faecium]HAZ1114283.1 DUF1642 domain-containing protein [Enterococcus faecium]HAZ1211886.1 DUF1642 domain-containing protein [Enterococcus faecium]
MNKQELINELTKYVERYEGATDEYYQGKSSAYEVALKLAKKLGLDEPQKPVIPQLVAGWLEKSTDPFTKAEKIAYLIKSKDGDSYYFCDWFVRDGIVTQEQREELLAWATRQSYETLLSLYNGYEVEKEPLYYVKLPVVYFNHWDLETYLMKDDRGNITIADNNDFDNMKFTESEIKAIDERYWPFAVPVEEVVEG